MATARITGVTGHHSSDLAEFLVNSENEVVGLHRRSSTATFERISHRTDKMTRWCPLGWWGSRVDDAGPCRPAGPGGHDSGAQPLQPDDRIDR
jgi:hypothetical protein